MAWKSGNVKLTLVSFSSIPNNKVIVLTLSLQVPACWLHTIITMCSYLTARAKTSLIKYTRQPNNPPNTLPLPSALEQVYRGSSKFISTSIKQESRLHKANTHCLCFWINVSRKPTPQVCGDSSANSPPPSPSEIWGEGLSNAHPKFWAIVSLTCTRRFGVKVSQTCTPVSDHSLLINIRRCLS